VQVPQLNLSPSPSFMDASGAIFKSAAIAVVSVLFSSLDMLSALFQMPGQCTMRILYWDKKFLMRITALFTELCIQRKFKWSVNK
jgi:hypothetical protein